MQPVLDATQCADRIHECRRSGRRRPCREPGEAGERHRLRAIRIRHERQWLDSLKQIAPRLKRVLVLRDPSSSTGIAQLAGIMSGAHSLGVEVGPLDVRVPAESNMELRHSRVMKMAA